MPTPSETGSWQDPRPGFSLETGDVHVWRVQLADWRAQMERLRSMLSASERARAERFVFAPDRADFTVARGMLRHLLGKYLAKEPGEIVLITGDRGKPAIANHMNLQGITFNISHSQGL